MTDYLFKTNHYSVLFKTVEIHERKQVKLLEEMILILKLL